MISAMARRRRMVPSASSQHRSEDTPMNEAIAWESVLQRDATADARFLYGVRATGIYCRPSCPSRKPRRDNVAFFSSSEAAERAGFRASQRRRPNRAKFPDRAAQVAADSIDQPI